MKREQLGWIVACLLLVVVAAGAMQRQAGPVGRFQIITGVVPQQSIVAGRPSSSGLTVLLNTETGEARPLIDGQDGVGWNPPLEIEGQEWK
jgi:hypothetical protein